MAGEAHCHCEYTSNRSAPAKDVCFVKLILPFRVLIVCIKCISQELIDYLAFQYAVKGLVSVCFQGMTSQQLVCCAGAVESTRCSDSLLWPKIDSIVLTGMVAGQTVHVQSEVEDLVHTVPDEQVRASLALCDFRQQAVSMIW